jgi:hypothetical protein
LNAGSSLKRSRFDLPLMFANVRKSSGSLVARMRRPRALAKQNFCSRRPRSASTVRL